MYNKRTNDIDVTVEPSYLEEQSMPGDHRFLWAYRICITNNSNKTVCLRSRYWKITDSNGLSQEIEGDGVIGEQPVLAPGESFEYTSGAPLTTPSGFMVGAYGMEDVNGDPFMVDIPAFSLDSPHHNGLLH